jgi:DNA-binding MarR family transcriptional regulator
MGAQAVLISDMVASRVGLHSSDLECLDLLYLAGSTTAGRLAAHTGLTTGAITAVIDRLERAGFVHRRRNGTDRRVVLVEVVKSSARQIAPFYEVLHTLLTRVNARYAAHELAVIADYLSRVLEAGAEHVAWLEQQPCAARRRRRIRAATGEPWLDYEPGGGAFCGAVAAELEARLKGKAGARTTRAAATEAGKTRERARLSGQGARTARAARPSRRKSQ